MRPYAVAVVTGALTMLSALVSAVPLPYLIAASCVSATCMLSLMLRANEWWVRNNPDGKLQAISPFYGYDVTKQGDGLTLEKVQFGVQIINAATYPIFYELESIDTRFEGRVSRESGYKKKTFEVAPGTSGIYKDDIIVVDMRVVDGLRSGRLKFKICYFRRPSRKYYIEKDWRLHAVIAHDDGKINWNYTLD